MGRRPHADNQWQRCCPSVKKTISPLHQDPGGESENLQYPWYFYSEDLVSQEFWGTTVYMGWSSLHSTTEQHFTSAGWSRGPITSSGTAPTPPKPTVHTCAVREMTQWCEVTENQTFKVFRFTSRLHHKRKSDGKSILIWEFIQLSSSVGGSYEWNVRIYFLKTCN